MPYFILNDCVTKNEKDVINFRNKDRMDPLIRAVHQYKLATITDKRKFRRQANPLTWHDEVCLAELKAWKC